MFCLFAAICLVRLKPAIAKATSAGSVSQLGLMRGASMVSDELMETVPREAGATRQLLIVAYWYP